ncbi:hypothetical protein [Blastopirellula marina]|uniref:Uncharacterized protein n=1 Tax=Blastopirellula marina DSM 3645 TaxID=314230 RepID=A3ZNU3_9BACT|nr:hypothetical protein [Blastopirellula marina]EAQ81991.1 hypothetical protein DSM3645_17605 [Blastopirellula marina DSM 3645]
MIASSGNFESGFSDAAKAIKAERVSARRHMNQLATFSIDPAIRELLSVWNNCRTPNWDGYGATSVSETTVRNAVALLEALPLGWPLPSIGSEPDGHITLEWYQNPRQLLSVSIDENSSLYYAAILGNEDPRGTCRFDREVPETILYWIRRVLR